MYICFASFWIKCFGLIFTITRISCGSITESISVILISVVCCLPRPSTVLNILHYACVLCLFCLKSAVKPQAYSEFAVHNDSSSSCSVFFWLICDYLQTQQCIFLFMIHLFYLTNNAQRMLQCIAPHLSTQLFSLYL